MSTVTERAQEQLFPIIPKTMQAVVCYGPEDYRLETVDVPVPGPEEILTKVELCGICMGDIKTYRGAPSFWGDAEQPRYVKPPMIPGHEFVCRVVALGPDAEKRGVKVGDRVISEQIVPCWGCRFCNHGQYWMCQKHDLYGFQNNVQGAMAQYMIFTKEGIIHKVPDSIAPDEAILIEPWPARCMPPSAPMWISMTWWWSPAPVRWGWASSAQCACATRKNSSCWT